ncbi:MAG TPA: penicillin acylase family protein, partial [Blastocatellia bacterium]|nr:penicillin acylase family protein [Blastocatellia bacterium]
MRYNRAIICLILALEWSSLLPGDRAASARSARDGRGSAATVSFAELHGRVVIRRDERGIPYIEAGHEDDLYFAQGYVTALDRLWQMDLLRRTGRGELSEIFGPSALEEDRLTRIYGFASLAEAAFENTSPSLKAALKAYARGVNAAIRSLDEKSLPPEFRILKYSPRPWSPADSIVVGKVLSKQLSTSWPADLMRGSLGDLSPKHIETLFPETSLHDLVLVGSDRPKNRRDPTGASHRPQSRAAVGGGPDPLPAILEAKRRLGQRVGLLAEGLAASNNWVVSGRRTSSGKPMLANDPHLSPSAPSIWYLAHLSAPGFRVSGVTIPGTPGILIGHNDSIAWGVTNLGPDVQDLYL